MCADLGYSPKKAHNLRRQLTLPEAIRTRIAERPAGGQLSVGMANRLADMHDVAAQLTSAVAERISSSELHDKAVRDLGAFVHRTIVEDEHTYAVRIDDGAVLDAGEQIGRARAHLTADERPALATILGWATVQLEHQLDALATRARKTTSQLTINAETRDRARVGQFAFVYERGRDFADSIWVVSPLFMLELAHEQLAGADETATVTEEGFFGGAALDEEELGAAGELDREQRDAERKRRVEAANRNLGLGHDLRAELIDPTPSQLQALKAIVCRVLVEHYREIIAYDAGWTDEERQRPVGETSRREPQPADQIIEAELDRALADPDPLRGIAQLTARWAAAFVLDPDGIPRTKPLGTNE